MNSKYILNEYRFVGGGKFETNAYCYKKSGNIIEPLDLSQATVVFSVTEYQHEDDTPTISKVCETTESTEGYRNIAVLELTSEETVDLFGMYSYQITIIDNSNNEKEIVGFGKIYIDKNIDPNLIKGN